MTENLANNRARFAFDMVKKVSEISGDALQKYRSLARSFPAMILSNGYGLAIAYLYSKSGNQTLYQHIETWLQQQNMLPNKEKGLMDNLAHADQSTYRLLESETLALLEWLKRFAEGAGSV